MTLYETLERIAAVLGGALVIFLPFELWQRHRQGRLTWAMAREMAASASLLIPTVLTAGLVTGFIFGLYSLAAGLRPWTIPVTPWTLLATLILVDLTYYWDHRISHRVRLLWAVSHSVHHSSHQFDQTTALRVSFIDGFISPSFYAPLVLIGFEPLAVLGCFGVMLAYQQWIHTETIGRLGWFDAVFNSPSNHRVHHGAQAQYLDRNYGGILIIWDRMFGTYAAEDEPVIYGLTEPLNTSNPVTIHIAEAVKLARDVRRARSAGEVWLRLFGPPGAEPDAAGAGPR
jgi:sterol desaturase/sphingolipid hydroxylase (fatty acid hydroxylase superfamily)